MEVFIKLIRIGKKQCGSRMLVLIVSFEKLVLNYEELNARYQSGEN